MRDACCGGFSLEAIGATCDPILSGERVRQIVARAKRRAAARRLTHQ